MKKYLKSALLFCATAIIMVSCSDDETLKFHPNIESYTSGTVSRFAPVSISFTEELSAEEQTQEYLEKSIKISPSCDVKFNVTDNYIVTMQPKHPFDRDTEYKVTVKMDKFIDGLDTDLSKFSFKFRTLPLLCHGRFEVLRINEDDENYDVTFTLVTADKENASDAEQLVSFSETSSISWNHDASGRVHTATLAGIQPKDKSRELKYTLTNSGEYPSEGTIRIPDKNEFSVYDVVVKEGSERCVYVYFTKNLDLEQDIEGLAYIDGNTNERVQMEGNCIKIFYDEKLKGAVNIIVNKGIKSSKGLVMKSGATIQRTLGNSSKPILEFVSQGAVLPLSSNMNIQFKSAYLKGVIVRVIEVPQRNMGQFLQTANLDGEGETKRVGRLVNQEVIFLDEDPVTELTEPHIFSINLTNLFNAEAGNLYRIELSASSKLSVFPCSDLKNYSKNEIKSYFSQHFAEEKLSLEGDGYYYYFRNGDSYNWEDGDNPCKESFYDNLKCSKNVVATNLGMTAKSGSDGKLHVWVNNLIDTKAEGGVEIKVYNFQHGITAEERTDADGYAVLDCNNGKPYYMTASKEGDISYLRIDDGSSLSMSEFDTSGKVLQSGLNGFIYCDRGVWRPGDTLHIGFMLGDRASVLPKEHPVILELTNPLGQTYTRRTLTKGILGTYAFSIPISSDAVTGLWLAKISVGGASFTKYLRIETIVPNRLKVSPDFGQGIMEKGKPVSGILHTEWLNGAVARGYKYDIQPSFSSAETAFKSYKNYKFTMQGSSFALEDGGVMTGKTDEKGDAKLNFVLNGGSKAPGMLNVSFTTKVYEPSGQFSIDVTRKQYSPYFSYVGVSAPQNGKSALETDKKYPVKFVTVDADGNAMGGQRISVKIYKMSWYWWWNSDDSYLAEYASSQYAEPVLEKDITTDVSGNASFEFSCSKNDWGVYLIYAKNLESGHQASQLSYFDWPDNPEHRGQSDAAFKLDFFTDKETYLVGEKIKFSIPSIKGAKALVTVENGSKVVDYSIYKCDGKNTDIQIPVTTEMRPNVFVSVSLIQPYAQTENDVPMRLYGVANVTVNDPNSHLNPVIEMNGEIKPNTDFSIKVSEKNGKEMAYTIAIVDEGLLDLTHFKTPNPWDAFNAQEALGVRTWDLYNMVIGAYGGKIEQMFSIGGDEDAVANGAKAMVNRFAPVVKFVGPFYLKGGSATHKFHMPNYNGKVRVMVVAGNGNAYGSAEKSVTVRQPVMVIGTLPRVIGQGEEITIPATVFATKAGVGNVKVSVFCSNKFSIEGESEVALNFTTIDDVIAKFKIKAGDIPGKGTITIKAESGSCKSEYSAELTIRNIADEMVKFQDLTVAPGKTWNGNVQSFGMPGTNTLDIELGGVRPINLSSRLDYLKGYPHGCVEQVVSKAFPQIYLNDITDLSEPDKRSAEAAVTKALNSLSSYQVFDGSLAYWQGSSHTSIWGTIYAAHFIVEAENAGYNIPYSMKQNLMKYLRNSASGWSLSKKANGYTKGEEITIQAYRLYVLSLSGESVTGSLNRLKEEANGSLSKWLVAGAYALAGRNDMCEKLIHTTNDFNLNFSGANVTFGSDIRDNALRLQVLCILDKRSEADALYNQIADNLASAKWYSTQDVAVALSSVEKYQKKYGKPQAVKGTITYGDASEKFNTTVEYANRLAEGVDSYKNITIENKGSQPVYVRFINKGCVNGDNMQAQSSGMGLAVSYTDLNFSPIDEKNLQQGTNFLATVTIKNNSPLDIGNVAVTHIIPSGWEILNTRFASEQSDTFDSGISYQDVKDDRVLTYIDNLPAGKQTIITLKLTASYIGSYKLPQIKCEAMYNSLISARTAASRCLVRSE
ncbi:MAG: MG2 domain-containing protein [Paludibacteraceae bacterium]|nr:MG2 domain-containing protein [Paludibacteraceae bacterium]